MTNAGTFLEIAFILLEFVTFVNHYIAYFVKFIIFLPFLSGQKITAENLMKKSIMFFLSLDEVDCNIVLYKITNYAIFVFF